jgi:uncharacterized protein (TIGR03086 family)
MESVVERHRRACDAFTAVADAVPDDRWGAATPCSEWDARALVEHVIGFHEFLLLRPMGVRAHRPREDTAARWRATSAAMFEALDVDGALDQITNLPGGGQGSARATLPSLTTDVVVHTWDLGTATGREPSVDPELVAAAYDAVRGADLPRTSGMFGAEVVIDEGAPVVQRLVAFYGRDPHWAP